MAERHGFDLTGIEIFELVPPELSLDVGQRQTLVHSSDLELGETVQMALAEVERIKPDRIVFDSLSEIRLLSQGSLRYRRQVLALKSFFLLNRCTALMLDDLTGESDDLNLQQRLPPASSAWNNSSLPMAGSAGDFVSSRCVGSRSAAGFMILSSGREG